MIITIWQPNRIIFSIFLPFPLTATSVRYVSSPSFGPHSSELYWPPLSVSSTSEQVTSLDSPLSYPFYPGRHRSRASRHRRAVQEQHISGREKPLPLDPQHRRPGNVDIGYPRGFQRIRNRDLPPPSPDTGSLSTINNRPPTIVDGHSPQGLCTENRPPGPPRRSILGHACCTKIIATDPPALGHVPPRSSGPHLRPRRV